MKRIIPQLPFWNISLLVLVVFAAFLLPVFPGEIHRKLFRVVYSLIYLAAVFNIKKKTGATIALFMTTILLEWISGIFSMQGLNLVAKAANILFFLLVIFSLIWQIAAARKVNTEVILGSVIGYLLIGIIYSIFIAIIMQHDPGAFSKGLTDESGNSSESDTSVPLYLGFVTLATVGYGDIVPLKPYTRSLATFIAVSGQFYIAVIVALLVGKFSVSQSEEKRGERS